MPAAAQPAAGAAAKTERRETKDEKARISGAQIRLSTLYSMSR
jgi:hypothetical protein